MDFRPGRPCLITTECMSHTMATVSRPLSGVSRELSSRPEGTGPRIAADRADRSLAAIDQRDGLGNPRPRDHRLPHVWSSCGMQPLRHPGVPDLRMRHRALQPGVLALRHGHSLWRKTLVRQASWLRRMQRMRQLRQDWLPSVRRLQDMVGSYSSPKYGAGSISARCR